MSGLPAGWHWTTLGQLGRYLNGRGFKKSDWRSSGRPIIRIQNLTGSSDVFNYFDGHAEESYIARPGDLLVSWAATLGAYIWQGPEAVVNQHIFKVESFIDAKFHKYMLDHNLSALTRETHGSGMVHVTRGRFDAVPVAVPNDMAEQRRIVDILEDHLSRLDAAESNLRTALRRSRRLAICTLLTNQVVEAAPVAALGSLLCEPLANGRSVPTLEDGFPVLRLTALATGDIDLGQRKGGAWTAREAAPYLVQRGDFFVSRGNGSIKLVARGALVRRDPDPVAFPDTMVRIRIDPTRMNSEYLELVWNSPQVRRQIEAGARTTAGIYKVNQRQLEAVVLPVPDLAGQRHVIDELGAASAAAAALEGAVALQTARSSALRRALLAAAFSGRLTGRSSDMDMVEESLASSASR